MTHLLRAGLLVVALLLVAGCGGDATSAPPGVDISTTSTSGAGTSDTLSKPSDQDADAATTTIGFEGEPAPDFTLALSDGTEFTLSEEEQPVYLVFWAEWCPTCMRELPKVADIAPDYADQVRFVAVAGRGDLGATASRATDLFGDRLQWGLSDDVWGAYRINAQPVSVLISGDDQIVEQWAGIAEEAQIRERLDHLAAIG